MVRVWTLQSLSGYEAALKAGAVRASPKHLENGDFCNEDSYGFMSHELQKRVGPCSAEVSQSWLERGGSGLPAPVWVWQQFRSRAQPEYVPEPWVCGERAVLLEAEVPREEVLPSQFNAFNHVLNDIPLPLTEEEDEELSALKTTEPEAFRERKLQSWQRIFEVEWEGDTIYGLQHGDDAQLQAVLWQLPLSALVRPALRFVNLAPYVSEEKRSVAYPPHGPPLGEDVQLDAVWIRRKSTNPPLHLQFTVKHLVTEGLAAKCGVQTGWQVTCLLNPIDDEDPLPWLVSEIRRHRGNDDSDGDGAPAPRPSAAVALEQLRKVRGVEVVFEAPREEPDSSEEPCDEHG